MEALSTGLFRSRKLTLLFFLLILPFLSLAQNVGINSSGNAPNPNAMLDVESSDMGLLIPRMTNAERSSFGSGLGSGDEGMTVYDSDDDAYYLWDGGSWVQFDMDPDNETISNINLTGSSILEITEAGVTHTQDLSSLGGGGGGHWSRDAAAGYLYPSNLGDAVGINTNTPSNARLEVQGASNERVAHIEGNWDGASGVVRTGLFQNNGHASGSAKYRALQGAALGNDLGSGRAHGVYGRAGGRDINVGIYGQLQSGTGAGVYGTIGGANLDLASNSYAGYFNGDLAYTGSLLTPSDGRLKADLKREEDALAKLDRIETYSYRFKEHEYMQLPDGRHYGFLAQEVEEVLPELVEGGEKAKEEGSSKNYLKMNYLEFIPLLTRAINEQQRIIEEQEKELEEEEKEKRAMKERLKRLEKRVDRLEQDRGTP